MKLPLSFLIVVMSAASICAAVLTPVPVGGVRINYDTTGTNTISSKVTVTAQTNLNTGTLQATNSVNVGRSGETGVISLSSTNGSYTINLSLDSSGTLTISYGSTNLLLLAIPSGNDGSTNLFLAADGHYYAAGGGR